MSNNKQSSVEFLTMQLIKNGIITNDDLRQAKAMHEEEIEDAYWEGGQDVPVNGQQCQQYYNETFGE